MIEHRVQVLIVDDHVLVRESLTELINLQKDMVVCGTAESVPDALAFLETVSADILVVDLSLRGSCGLDLIKTAKGKWPDIGVVVMSMRDEMVHAQQCKAAGASAYVMKLDASRRILPDIRQVQGSRCIATPRAH